MATQSNKITLTNDEIALFNSLMKNENINFFLYSHDDMESNKLLAIQDTEKGKEYRKDDRTAAENLFNKFCGTDCNYISKCTIEGKLIYAARCAVSKSITNKFPDDKVDKSILLEILKTMIDPSQHEKLIKESEIKDATEENQIEKNKQDRNEPSYNQKFLNNTRKSFDKRGEKTAS